jgi:hypothetical protein
MWNLHKMKTTEILDARNSEGENSNMTSLWHIIGDLCRLGFFGPNLDLFLRKYVYM